PCTYLRLHPPTTPTSFPYTTLFRSYKIPVEDPSLEDFMRIFELNCRSRNLRYHEVMVAYLQRRHYTPVVRPMRACHPRDLLDQVDRKSTRLNSSHEWISYAVFCLKK